MSSLGHFVLYKSCAKTAGARLLIVCVPGVSRGEGWFFSDERLSMSSRAGTVE